MVIWLWSRYNLTKRTLVMTMSTSSDSIRIRQMLRYRVKGQECPYCHRVMQSSLAMGRKSQHLPQVLVRSLPGIYYYATAES